MARERSLYYSPKSSPESSVNTNPLLIARTLCLNKLSYGQTCRLFGRKCPVTDCYICLCTACGLCTHMRVCAMRVRAMRVRAMRVHATCMCVGYLGVCVCQASKFGKSVAIFQAFLLPNFRLH